MSDLQQPGESILVSAERIAKRESEGASVAVVSDGRRVGVEASAKKDLGKGWSLSAWGQWIRGAGHSAAAVIGWTPRPAPAPRRNNDDEDDGA